MKAANSRGFGVQKLLCERSGIHCVLDPRGNEDGPDFGFAYFRVHRSDESGASGFDLGPGGTGGFRNRYYGQIRRPKAHSVLVVAYLAERV
jgi:hypothetical protein